jgi:serine/threonine protein kinase
VRPEEFQQDGPNLEQKSSDGADRTIDNSAFRDERQGTLVNANSLQLGRILGGRYQLLEVLGEGGMSAVFLSRHKELDQLVAIKVLRFDRSVGDDSLKRFLQEAKATFQLNHPNLIRLLDFSAAEEELPYLVMEYVSGTTLSDVLKEKGQLDAQEFVNIFGQVCDGLAYAHSKGIVHRDLKPSNIMLATEPDGTRVVKIVDFGIAKMAHSDKEQHLTKTGEIFGSPFYMSPEQCRGLSPDKRSDLYSMGCAMFECLSGSVPYRGENSMRTLFMHIDEPIPTLKLPKYRSFATARALEEVTHRLLQKDPEDRFQNASDVKKSLIDCLNRPDRQRDDDVSNEKPLRQSPPSSKASSGSFNFSRKRGAIAAGVILALAGGVFAYSNRKPSPSPKVIASASNTVASAIVDDQSDEALKKRDAALIKENNKLRERAKRAEELPEDREEKAKEEKAKEEKAKEEKTKEAKAQKPAKTNAEKLAEKAKHIPKDDIQKKKLPYAAASLDKPNNFSSSQLVNELQYDLKNISGLRKARDLDGADALCRKAYKETEKVDPYNPVVRSVYFSYLSLLFAESEKDRPWDFIIHLAQKSERLMTNPPEMKLVSQGAIYGFHAQALMGQHHYPQALEYFKRAVHCCVSAGSEGDARVADWVSGEAHAMVKMGKMPAALDLVSDWEVAARRKNPLAHFIMLTTKASLLRDANETDRARQALREAKQVLERMHPDASARECSRFNDLWKKMQMH